SIGLKFREGDCRTYTIDSQTGRETRRAHIISPQWIDPERPRLTLTVIGRRREFPRLVSRRPGVPPKLQKPDPLHTRERATSSRTNKKFRHRSTPRDLTTKKIQYLSFESPSSEAAANYSGLICKHRSISGGALPFVFSKIHSQYRF